MLAVVIIALLLAGVAVGLLVCGHRYDGDGGVEPGDECASEAVVSKEVLEVKDMAVVDNAMVDDETLCL